MITADILEKLAKTNGQITAHEGILWLPDGEALDLRNWLPRELAIPTPEPSASVSLVVVPDRLWFGIASLPGGTSANGKALYITKFELRMAYSRDDLYGQNGDWEVVGVTSRCSRYSPEWIKQSQEILNALEIPYHYRGIVGQVFDWLQARSMKKLFWQTPREQQLAIIRKEFRLE